MPWRISTVFVMTTIFAVLGPMWARWRSLMPTGTRWHNISFLLLFLTSRPSRWRRDLVHTVINFLHLLWNKKCIYYLETKVLIGLSLLTWNRDMYLSWGGGGMPSLFKSSNGICLLLCQWNVCMQLQFSDSASKNVSDKLKKWNKILSSQWHKLAISGRS